MGDDQSLFGNIFELVAQAERVHADLQERHVASQDEWREKHQKLREKYRQEADEKSQMFLRQLAGVRTQLEESKKECGLLGRQASEAAHERDSLKAALQRQAVDRNEREPQLAVAQKKINESATTTPEKKRKAVERKPHEKMHGNTTSAKTWEQRILKIVQEADAPLHLNSLWDEWGRRWPHEEWQQPVSKLKNAVGYYAPGVQVTHGDWVQLATRNGAACVSSRSRSPRRDVAPWRTSAGSESSADSDKEEVQLCGISDDTEDSDDEHAEHEHLRAHKTFGERHVALLETLARGACTRFDPSRNVRLLKQSFSMCRVMDLHFTHSDVSRTFLHGPHKGEHVVDLVHKLQTGAVTPSDLPPLVVVVVAGANWVVYGNRRLKALREFAATSRLQVKAKCIMHDATECNGALLAKFLLAWSTCNGGKSATFR